MPNRRLTLARENLTSLQSDELASIAGAISGANPLCPVYGSTSAMHSACATCGINCTWDCATS